MGSLKAVQQACATSMASARAAVCAQQDDELIAAEARHRGMLVRVRKLLQRVPQALGDDAQHRIAHGVTEGIVDALEAVQIQIQDGHLFARPRPPSANRCSAVSMQRCRFGKPVSGS